MKKTKRIMINGDMQSGKTKHLVEHYLGKQNNEEIEVFINYNTNSSMQSTNDKIKNFRSSKEIYSGLEKLRSFHHLLTRKKLDLTKKYVLSLIAHHASLEELKSIITAYSQKYGIQLVFNINIDEDDSLCLDHSIRKTHVQKQRLAQVITELPGIKEIRNVTATTFVNHLSETDFDERYDAPVGKGYCGVEKVIDNAKATFEYEDIESFFTMEPSSNIQHFINDDFKGATLIQISKNKKDHAVIAGNILRLCKQDNVVGIANSDESSFTYYINGVPYGKKDEPFNPSVAYELAASKGIQKVFIIAFYLSDRTNTFRAPDGLFNNLRSLFYCAPSTNIETKLQRVGRLCGYPINHIPALYTDQTTLEYLYEALNAYEVIKELQTTKDIRLAKVREKLLKGIGKLPLDKISHTNGYKNHESNTYLIEEEVLEEDLITTKGEGKVPDNISMFSTDLSINTDLYNYLKEAHRVNTVLNITANPQKLQNMIRPNQNIMQAHRELAVLFKENREYTYIRQILPVYPTHHTFALHTIGDKYFQWTVKSGVSKNLSTQKNNT